MYAGGTRCVLGVFVPRVLVDAPAYAMHLVFSGLLTVLEFPNASMRRGTPSFHLQISMQHCLACCAHHFGVLERLNASRHDQARQLMDVFAKSYLGFCFGVKSQVRLSRAIHFN